MQYEIKTWPLTLALFTSKTCRPYVLALGKPPEFIAKDDSLWQTLIRLAHGNNAKRSYQKVLTQLSRATT